MNTGHQTRWTNSPDLISTVNRPGPKRKPTRASHRRPSDQACATAPVSRMTILLRELTMDNQSGAAANSFCGGCGAPLEPGTRFCPSCGKPVEAGLESSPAPVAPAPPAPQPPQQFPVQPAGVSGTSQQGLACPRCGSTRVQTEKRGWKWTTGMIGSGNTVNTCLQCGNKF